MASEEVVVMYINGEVDVPAEFRTAVSRYRELAFVADHAPKVSLVVDREMDELYDLMVDVVE